MEAADVAGGEGGVGEEVGDVAGVDGVLEAEAAGFVDGEGPPVVVAVVEAGPVGGGGPVFEEFDLAGMFEFEGGEADEVGGAVVAG